MKNLAAQTKQNTSYPHQNNSLSDKITDKQHRTITDHRDVEQEERERTRSDACTLQHSQRRGRGDACMYRDRSTAKTHWSLVRCGEHNCGWAMFRNTEVPLRNRRYLHIDGATSKTKRDWLMKIRNIEIALEPVIPVHRASVSHVHFGPHPCSSTHLWTKHSTHRYKKTTPRRDISPGHNAAFVLSCPCHPCSHRMCVSAKGLVCLLQLAHAAGHGHFLISSTCERTFPVLGRLLAET